MLIFISACWMKTTIANGLGIRWMSCPPVFFVTRVLAPKDNETVLPAGNNRLDEGGR
jgi:hypothetical protein